MTGGAARGTLRRLLPPLVVALAVFLALGAVRRLLLRPPPVSVPEPVALSFPAMLGCWELDVGDWELTPAGVSLDSATAALLVAPDRVLLIPDSTDEWRRSYTTYRAAPVTGRHDPRLGGYLRWFLRADTLWLVWSDRTVRAGIALLSGESRLDGAARAVIGPAPPSRPGTVDGRASAAAWKVNCRTGLRDVERRGPRP